MKQLTENLPKIFVLTFFLGGIGIFLYEQLWSSSTGSAKAEFVVPEFSPLAKTGEQLFSANCLACHGENAKGTKSGPPLVHDIYNPGHHPDDSFYLAVQQGVRQHHWPFGNMPAQRQVCTADVRAIIKYVRELQVANGITYRPHVM